MDSQTQMYWIIGGIVAVLLLVLLWVRYGKVSPAHMRPAQGSYLQGVSPYSPCLGICNDPIMRYDCANCICSEVCQSKVGSGKRQCMAQCMKGQEPEWRPPAHLQKAGYDY